MNRQIILLSAPVGSGHLLAARAIRENIAEHYKNIDVVEATAFDFLPWNLGKLFLRVYLAILRCCPWLYQAAYRWGNQQSGSLMVRDCLNSWLAARAEKWLRRQQPFCIICTHATPAGIVSAWKRKYSKTVPLYGVVTDYVVHSWWLYPEVDAYFVAHENVKKMMVPRLWPHQAAHACGIPIRAGFSLPFDAMTFRREQVIAPDSFVCLLMGGGEGLLPMEELINCCSRLENVHVVAVTGGNAALYRRLLPLQSERVTVLGLVSDIWCWMKAADLLISKAGGVTAAEAMAVGLPLAFYRPLPGQEAGNVRFLQSLGAAVELKDMNGLQQHVQLLQAQKESGGKGKTKNDAVFAARHIVLTILGKNSASSGEKA